MSNVVFNRPTLLSEQGTAQLKSKILPGLRNFEFDNDGDIFPNAGLKCRPHEDNPHSRVLSTGIRKGTPRYKKSVHGAHYGPIKGLA